MTKKDIIIQIKSTALNKIRKIYNPYNYEDGKGLMSFSWSDSWAEQRDYKVKKIIEELEKDLIKAKNKFKNT